MVRWVVGSILHGVDPLSYFSFQPVLHGSVHVVSFARDDASKRSLAVNQSIAHEVVVVGFLSFYLCGPGVVPQRDLSSTIIVSRC